MNHCDEMKDALAEVALGEQPSETLAAHLAECAACTARLERQRALAQRMDAAVLALVRAQPAERLQEDIAARFRLAAPGSRRRQRSWIAAGAALAASIALFLGVRGLQPHTTPIPNTVALTQWRSPTAVLLEPLNGVRHAPSRDGSPSGSPSTHSQRAPGVTHAS